MPDLSWKLAILKVLEAAPEAMHYTEIAEAIANSGYRTALGATPASTVNAMISTSLQSDGSKSPYVRVSRGYYALKSKSGASAPTIATQPSPEPQEETGLVNAFGMYWSRDAVLWTNTPKLLGQQQPGSTPVDFFRRECICYMMAEVWFMWDERLSNPWDSGFGSTPPIGSIADGTDFLGSVSSLSQNREVSMRLPLPRTA